MSKILFVCLGNICRSPLAHGIAEKISEKNSLGWTIDSAGTSDWHIGEAPCDHSIKVASDHQTDISTQRSRPITKEDIKIFDYVVAMDRQNKADMETFGFKNVHLLGDFAGYNGKDIPDPYFFDGFEGFEKVYTMVELCVSDFIGFVQRS
ncbi:low molecular weight protein-tyrosine-phosphatase [Sulfurovum sp.]|uniref:low molecular weight protein-tyrosine-phosphatase n=1 Tax=Sulfurovum sp. TaxID=1969726 RepID=UPI002867B5DB|nr:low molecular weight protein-tyrosine-phosphatase [Sulfurovum sp.]